MKRIYAIAGAVAFLGGIVGVPLRVEAQSWSSYAGNAQHTALSTVESQSLNQILWSTPVDLDPQFSGNDLLIHYGSPLVSANNTVIVPVKTGATGGFEVEALDGATGSLLWSDTTDFALPAHDWTPSFSPALTASGRIYEAGAGGTLYYRDNVDSATGTFHQVAFYGNSNYTANESSFNSSIKVCTPITTDAAGNVYFGYRTTGSNPLGITSGIARIGANGTTTYISASAATDGGASQIAMNCAPALSNDGKTVYIAANGGSNGAGYLLALNSTTLSTQADVLLKDPKSGQNADVNDDSTASPMVGPDGQVYYGVLESPFNSSKGWMLQFNANLSKEGTPGAFGWDDTASVVPASMVPSYHGTSTYLLLTKYNNYAELGGDGVNKLAILDPNATQVDPRTGETVMQAVETIAGVTPDTEFTSTDPNAVREWCINSAAVDPFSDSILAGSEDGKLYRWDLATDSFTQDITLTPGIGEAYTPTVIGENGEVYAINDARLFAVGVAPEPGTLVLAACGIGALAVFARRRSRLRFAAS